MPIFIYTGRSRSGRKTKGDIDAPNLEAAESLLKRRGLTNLKVKPKPKDIFEGTFLEGKVDSRSMVIFSRQFATMINSGVPILQALQIMCEQTENKLLRRILYQVRNDIESGSSLYDALKKHPKVFDDLYTNMVDAGEQGGVLDVVLQRLAVFIEKAAKLKAKVKSAMIYPIIVLVIAVAVVMVIMIWVIPTFEKMFKDMQGGLPLPTQIAIDASRFVKGNVLFIIGGIIAFIVVFKAFLRWEKGRRVWDRTILFAPIFGNLLRKVAVARFSRTLSTMVASGVPILQALEIVSRTSGNKTVEAGVLKAKKSISEGQTLAEPLDETGVFPPMVIHMISIGESTGQLDAMLEKIADFYDDEVDVAVAGLTSMIEPLMIVFLGVVVGGLVVAMYLPIFKMGEVI